MLSARPRGQNVKVDGRGLRIKGESLANFRIVCCDFRTVLPHSHRHITGVGTGDDAALAKTQWPVEEVRQAIRGGHRFYTVSPSTGKQAAVEPDTCGCGYDTIRSTPDKVTDNNLDNLRACVWQRTISPSRR